MRITGWHVSRVIEPEVYAREITDELNVINPASPGYETFRKNTERNKKWEAEGK